jgi:outer membrane lipoprotein-sorting protein
MRLSRLLSSTVLMIACTATATAAAGAQDASARLKSTLDKLNQASVRFHYASASFHKDLYNALVKDHTLQDGHIYFLRTQKGGSKRVQMGARIEGVGARTVEYKDGVVKDFNPGINCFDAVSASGNQTRIESFLTLGFGGSGTDLEKAWNIVDQGPQTLGGTRVEELALTPKDPGVQGMVSSVTLWLDVERGVSLKQVFVSPSGDTTTATYSAIDTTHKPNTKPFEIKGKPCGK